MTSCLFLAPNTQWQNRFVLSISELGQAKISTWRTRRNIMKLTGSTELMFMSVATRVKVEFTYFLSWFLTYRNLCLFD